VKKMRHADDHRVSADGGQRSRWQREGGSMRHEFKLTVGIAFIAAAALLPTSCGDSASPTEPTVAATPTPAVSVFGTWTGSWTGSYFDHCGAVAGFNQVGIRVVGALQLSDSCQMTLDFTGTLQGNTLDGTFTDYDTWLIQAHGIVSGSNLQIALTDSAGTAVGELSLHR
jgi:hypothetical protein